MIKSVLLHSTESEETKWMEIENDTETWLDHNFESNAKSEVAGARS